MVKNDLQTNVCWFGGAKWCHQKTFEKRLFFGGITKTSIGALFWCNCNEIETILLIAGQKI
ncbi:MAG TPA: hypothetical protein VKR54_04180 [Candidatus Babeliales bacterium]|nr:hypothetical protein [Candidatus Babeliales bacterium]